MLSLEKKSFDLLVLKLSIPVRARVKRAFAGWGLPQSEHICSGTPMQQLPVPSRHGVVRLLRASQKQGLTCRKHTAGVRVLWQERCALNQARRVGDSPSGCPQRVSGWSCRVDEAVGPLPPGVGGLCCQSPAWPPAASSRWTQGDVSHKELPLSVRGSAWKTGGSKDLSSSRWIATHLVNQLIKCNEYSALGKPSETPPSPLYREFPTLSSFNLAVQWLLFFITLFIEWILV